MAERNKHLSLADQLLTLPISQGIPRTMCVYFVEVEQPSVCSGQSIIILHRTTPLWKPLAKRPNHLCLHHSLHLASPFGLATTEPRHQIDHPRSNSYDLDVFGGFFEEVITPSVPSKDLRAKALLLTPLEGSIDEPGA